MAIANEDGSIVIGIKLATQSVEKGLRDLVNKIKSSTKKENYFDALKEKTLIARSALEDYKKEYAKLVAVGKQDSKEGVWFQSAIKETESELKELTTASSVLGKKATKSFSAMAAGAKNFGKRIAGILKSALIFSVLYKVMQSVVKLFRNILVSDDEFRQDWEELKAAFYTAAYPIVNLIVPAIKWIVQQVRDWAVSIGKVAAALQGMSYSELVDQAKASKEAADNYEKMEKDSKKTADNVKKQLASFDDIQILSSGNEEEQGANGSGFEGLKEYDTSGEKSMLNDLMTSIGGALAAVGLILLFNGQIKWGIGFLVAGAAFWAIGEIWGEDYDPNSATDILSNIMETIGVSLAAIGIILITKGQFAWGIGFVIAGAVAGLFGVAIATLSDESVSQKAKDELSSGMIIVGVVAVVLGILLCMAQQWAWGIGLIATGVTSIVTPLVLNWDGIKEALTDEKTAGWLAVGGIIAIVLGVLLCFAQMWALGIGLIALGAATVATVVAVNWDAITTTVKDFIFENSDLIALISGGLLILGILICFINLPLGIALIAAGAAGLATVTALNWDGIVCWVKGAWDAVKGFWNKNIAPIFTIKWWKDLAIKCGNGLIAGFEGAINGIISAFESMINWIVNGLNKISFDLPEWMGGAHFGIDIPRAALGRVSIPRLAQGAVIPPNKEFLAVLGDQKQGTNIEAPLQTIVDAFNIALAQNGNYNGSGNTEVVLEIDGREFGRAVVEQGNRENRRIGTRLVIA